MRAAAQFVVMGHRDQGAAGMMQPFKQSHDFIAGIAVEVAGRFVRQNHARLHRHRTCNRDALTLAAGELVGPVAGALLKSVLPEQRGKPWLPLGRVDTRQHHRQLDVLRRGEARHEMKELEHEADLFAAHAGQFIVAEVRHVAAIEFIAAGTGAVEQADQIEQGGLAGA